MMVGALVLASCVKNQESQSVTDVRNARADEIKSQAELNRANAQAAVIYAKAEETIAAAQAQLLKAQADKTAAEAALIQAQADLAQVNVQIQLVKLEEEKVVLQAKKAELEKLIAEYEAAIAQADALKQEAINRLEKAVQQAELDEIKHQKALIDAQANLIQSLNGFADAQRNRVVALYTAYANATKQVYTLQAQLLQKQAALAKIEAHIDSGAEETYEAILAKKKEISTLQSRIDMIEYFSFESYEAALAEYEALMPAYATAFTAYQEGQIALAQAEQIWERYENPASENYIQPEFTNGWEPVIDDDDNILYCNKRFQDFILNELPYYDYELIYTFDPEGAKVFGYFDDNAVFVPLWKDEAKVYGSWYTYPAVDEMAHVVPSNWFWARDLESISPATIYYDNFKKFFDWYKEDLEDDKEWYEKNSGIPEKEAEIEALEEVMAKKADYIAKADAELDPAKAEMDAAEEEYEAADKAWDDAWDAIADYQVNFGYSSTELAKYMEAYSYYSEALEEDNIVDNRIARLENVTIPNCRAALVNAKEAQLEADKAVVEQEKVVAEKKAAVTDAIKTAYADAQTAVETAKAAVETKFNEYQTKLDDAHAKELLYQADPEDAAKKTAYEEAKTAAETAKTAYNDAVTAVGTKKAELATAKEAYDAVNDPYEAAEATLEVLEATALQKAQNVANAEKNLQDAKDALAEYQAQKLLTVEAVALAKAALDEAEAAYEALGTEEDPAFQTLLEAYEAAEANYDEKYAVYREARIKYYTLLASFNGYDYWEWDYHDEAPFTYNNYVLDFDPTYEDGDAYKLARLNEELVYLQQRLAMILQALEDNYAGVTAAEVELQQLKDIAEPAYHEWLAERVAAENAYIAIKKEFYDIVNEFYDVMMEMDAVESIIVYVENGNPYTMDTLDALVANLEKQIAEKQEELADLYKTFEAGDYGMTKVAELEGEIAELEAKIEMYEALAESYWAELEYIMSGPIE